MYNTFNVDTNVISFNKQKWERHFSLSKSQWQNIYQLPFINIKSSKLQWLQYRINHHILTTNSFLFKISKNDTNLRNLCKIEEETIYHLLWQCPIVQDLIFYNFFNFCNTRGIMVPRDPCWF